MKKIFFSVILLCVACSLSAHSDKHQKCKQPRQQVKCQEEYLIIYDSFSSIFTWGRLSGEYFKALFSNNDLIATTMNRKAEEQIGIYALIFNISNVEDQVINVLGAFSLYWENLKGFANDQNDIDAIETSLNAFIQAQVETSNDRQATIIRDGWNIINKVIVRGIQMLKNPTCLRKEKNKSFTDEDFQEVFLPVSFALSRSILPNGLCTPFTRGFILCSNCRNWIGGCEPIKCCECIPSSGICECAYFTCSPCKER